MGPDLNPRIEAAPMVAVLLALLPMAVAAHPPPNEVQLYGLFFEPTWSGQGDRFDTPHSPWRIVVGDQVEVTSPDGGAARGEAAATVGVVPHGADVDVCTTDHATFGDVHQTMMLLAELDASVVVRNAGALPAPCID